MDIRNFRDYIVVPALGHINLYSLEAEQLVMATAMAESNLAFIHQVGRGPARSFFQMEPLTHDDIWERYLPVEKLNAKWIVISLKALN